MTNEEAPDMVSVIAAAMEEHGFAGFDQDYGEAQCECGISFNTTEANPDDRTLHNQHRARAVLAAISEAGTVEWGVRTTLGMHVPYDTEEDARTIAAQHGSAPVSKIVLPWERAE